MSGGNKGAVRLISANDNSRLDELEKLLDEIENIDIADLAYSTGKDEDPSVNLGIRVYNKELWSGNYVGICKLKYKDHRTERNLVDKDGREVILKIEPRFKVSVPDMLNFVSSDEEFETYLAPQTTNNTKQGKAEDTINNKLFRFSEDEDPIFVEDELLTKNSSIITAANFICMLKALCLRPLMGKMLAKEENLTGKVKGKILISKNIRMNTIRGRDDRIYCRYLQYSEDIPENQVLKAALKKAVAVLNKYFNKTDTKKNTLMEIAGYCGNSLSHISVAKISRQDFTKIRPTGCYAYYKPVINIARMVLDEVSADADGQVKFTGYVVPYAVSMNRLYEMYARTYIKENLKTKEWGMAPYDAVISVLKENNKYYIGGTVKPDVILYSPKEAENDKFDPKNKKYKYTVLDVKYKKSDNMSHAREDRLQLLAYALMYNCDTVGLIFPPLDRPADGEENKPKKEECEINIQGGADKPRKYIQVVLPIEKPGQDTKT